MGSWSVQVALPPPALSMVCLWAPAVVITSANWERSRFSLRASLCIQSSTDFPGADCGPGTLGTGLLMELRRGCRKGRGPLKPRPSCVLNECFNPVQSLWGFCNGRTGRGQSLNWKQTGDSEAGPRKEVPWGGTGQTRWSPGTWRCSYSCSQHSGSDVCGWDWSAHLSEGMKEGESRRKERVAVLPPFPQSSVEVSGLAHGCRDVYGVGCMWPPRRKRANVPW